MQRTKISCHQDYLKLASRLPTLRSRALVRVNQGGHHLDVMAVQNGNGNRNDVDEVSLLVESLERSPDNRTGINRH